MHKKLAGEILEKGNIYFLYRPKVAAMQTRKTPAKSLSGLQRFYLVLHPTRQKQFRLLLIGHKKLPEIENSHEKGWALVDKVVKSSSQLRKILEETGYQTKTRGERKQPAVRPAGEGIYCIFKDHNQTYFTYLLEFPKKPGKVQKALLIKSQAKYVLSVKNPKNTKRNAGKAVQFPDEFLKKFNTRQFIAADPTDFLNYEGAELLFIGASLTAKKQLGEKRIKKQESLKNADIFSDLKLWRNKHPIKPLIKGEWA